MKTLSYDDIKALHEAELDIGRQFLATLLQERDFIITRNFSQLEALLKTKSDLAIILENQSKKREELMSQKRGMQNWTHFIDGLSVPHLSEQWDNLKNLLMQCRKENDINGKLIARNHSIYSDLLYLLRGNTEKTDMYSATGSKLSNTFSQTVAKA